MIPTMTKIRDLREGDLVEMSPALQWLEATGSHVGKADTMALDYELVIVVEPAELEAPADMGTYKDCLVFGEPELGVFGVEGHGSWALPADLELPVYGRLDATA